MGGCQSSTPDFSNSCSSAIGDTLQIPGFCTYAGVGGDSYRKQACSNISSEWSASGSGGICQFPAFNPTHSSSGCCDDGCAIVGNGVVCSRNSFQGDPLICCLKDLKCSTATTNDPCFSDPAHKNTCDPIYRSQTNTQCQPYLLDYCSGADIKNPNDTSWINRWQNPTTGQPAECYHVLQRNLFSFPNSGDPQKRCLTGPPLTGDTSCTPVNTNIFPINASGYNYSSALINAVFAKYQQTFTIGTLPGFAGFNSFQDFLYQNVCCKYPGLCNNGLKAACSTYTAQRLTLNPEASLWCGCNLPDGEYQNYVDRYQINKACTPMCARPGVIQNATGSGQPITCQQNICLIDNIAINLVNTSVNGVNFAQMCGGCQTPIGPTGTTGVTGSTGFTGTTGNSGNTIGVTNNVGNTTTSFCSCIIADSSITAVNSKIQGDVNLSQNCGSATCTIPNPDTSSGAPAMLTVPCTGNVPDPFAVRNQEILAAQKQANKKKLIYTLIFIAVVIVVVVIVILIVKPIWRPAREQQVARGTSRAVYDVNTASSSLIFGPQGQRAKGAPVEVGSVSIYNKTPGGNISEQSSIFEGQKSIITSSNQFYA